MVVVLGLLMAGLLYIGAPFLACAYYRHRFNHYIHVQVELSSCEAEPPVMVSGPCVYVFSFEGAEKPEAIQFEGTELRHTYNQSKRTYTVGGLGRIGYQGNLVQLGLTKVFANGRTIPRETQPSLVFVRQDGKLTSGYCDISW